jgi:uncharacterized protein
MRYEWDERKNHLNQRKHGISFEIAAQVFEDTDCILIPDRVDETGEQRWLAIGAVPLRSGNSSTLLVAHVYREDIYGEEIIRIISAREAGKYDIRRYKEPEMD